MLKTRLAAGLAVLAATASVTIAVAPAASADEYPYAVIEKEHLQYGASYLTGRVTFYNRGASVNGTAHLVGCRTFYAWTIDKQGDKEVPLDVKSSSPKCDGNFAIDIPLEANIVGGADRVIIEMRDGAGKPFPVREAFRYDLR